MIESPEQCDDGNRVNGDGCSASCTWEPKAISVGEVDACALGFDGILKCWGDGELGIGNTTSHGAGPNQMGDNLPAVDVGTGRTARTVTAGYSSCALLDNAELKCWGANGYGQLGLGDMTNRGGLPGQMGDNLPAVSLGTGRTPQSRPSRPSR
jgi:cysteine-rich repeat protein